MCMCMCVRVYVYVYMESSGHFAVISTVRVPPPTSLDLTANIMGALLSGGAARLEGSQGNHLALFNNSASYNSNPGSNPAFASHSATASGGTGDGAGMDGTNINGGAAQVASTTNATVVPESPVPPPTTTLLPATVLHASIMELSKAMDDLPAHHIDLLECRT